MSVTEEKTVVDITLAPRELLEDVVLRLQAENKAFRQQIIAEKNLNRYLEAQNEASGDVILAIRASLHVVANDIDNALGVKQIGALDD